MVITNQLRNQHLLWRAGFGPLAEDSVLIREQTQKAVFDALVKSSSRTPAYLNVASNMFDGLVMGIGEEQNFRKKDLSEEEKKAFRKQSRQDIRSLNLAWLNEMVTSEAQLREKMALFWHGHFASRNLNIYFQQLLLDAIRRNALGNFGDLLFAVSKSGAMINFLNNNENRKDHPNENFSRELMELFTLGRGHYSEQDVKEAARAFTGWGANLKGDFVFRNGQHDRGNKVFLGQSGPWDGDDILNILLGQRQTALFITTKIYRFFVNDQVNTERVQWLAARFFNSQYNIQSLLQDIFTSDWFYAEENIGSKIKSPVELLVGIRRQLPMDIDNPESLLQLQKLLGQLLFFPPNVAGWPGGTSWIDSSSLMLRLKIPDILFQSDELNLQAKEDDDQNGGMKEQAVARAGLRSREGSGFSRRLEAWIEWPGYAAQYRGIPRENLLPAIRATLLQQQAGLNNTVIERHLNTDSREQYIRTATLRLMSTPEYQLC